MNLRRFRCTLTNCDISLATVLWLITAVVGIPHQGRLRVISATPSDDSEESRVANNVEEDNLFDFDPK